MSHFAFVVGAFLLVGHIGSNATSSVGSENPDADTRWAPEICSFSDLSNLDSDADGIPDCTDTDDDNDLLADDAEAWLFGPAGRLDPDQDDDGILDSADLMPLRAGGVEASVTTMRYEAAGCDFLSRPDVYVLFWGLEGMPGGSIRLTPGPSWSSEIASGDPNELRSSVSVSSDIFEWPVKGFWEIPHLSMNLALSDADVLESDYVDIWDDDGAGEIARMWPLDRISHEIPLQGDAACRASVTFNASTSTTREYVRMSVARWSKSIFPGEPVTRADIENGPFR